MWGAENFCGGEKKGEIEKGQGLFSIVWLIRRCARRRAEGLKGKTRRCGFFFFSFSCSFQPRDGEDVISWGDGVIWSFSGSLAYF